MMGPSQWGEETITVRANGETHAMMLRIRLRCYDTQMLRKQNHGWVKGIDWHTCQSLFEVFVFFFQCVCRCLQMPTQHSTVRIVWILEYGMVWGLSRGTGGEQNEAIIINLTAIIIINRWHWYHHGGGLEMIFSHQMLCNHFHQPFLHYHHPQVQALYHCHDLCITPLVWHQQIAGQPQGMHRCTPRCYKKDKVSIFGRSLPIALGRFIGSPYIVPPKSAAQSKVAPRKRFTTPEFKCWSLLLWKIGYTLELSGSSQETILRVVLFSS